MSSLVIEELTPAERLALIGELWDSLESEQVPMTRAQIEELERRLVTADADAARGKTWAEFKNELPPRLK